MQNKFESSPTRTASAALATEVQPYLLTFAGRCQEALDFYSEVLGAEVLQVMRFKECPVPMPPEAKVDPDHVLHAAFRIGKSTLLATDCSCPEGGQTGMSGIALSVLFPDPASARFTFDALAQGGTIKQPIDQTFFAQAFGIVADRFGVTWMLLGGMKS